MEPKKQETNTFQDMENNTPISEQNVSATGNSNEPQASSQEISMTDFSDVAVENQKAYKRPDLNGTVDVIDMFQVEPADTTQEPETTKSKESEYWKPTLILTYASKNEDGVNNHEFISGAKVWKNRDGRPSKDINFYYEGGVENKNVCCILWEIVAEALDLEPKQLSPRQFVSFLNSKPKFKLATLKVDNFGAKAGQPKQIGKNMPSEHIKG